MHSAVASVQVAAALARRRTSACTVCQQPVPQLYTPSGLEDGILKCGFCLEHVCEGHLDFCDDCHSLLCTPGCFQDHRCADIGYHDMDGSGTHTVGEEEDTLVSQSMGATSSADGTAGGREASLADSSVDLSAGTSTQSDTAAMVDADPSAHFEEVD